MTPSSDRRKHDAAPMQHVLEDMPAMRSQRLARTRLIRQFLAALLAILLVALVVGVAWGAWTVNRASVEAQRVMRADKAASNALDSEFSETTLLVLRSVTPTAPPAIAIVRQPSAKEGTWVLVVPPAPIDASKGASSTPQALLKQGRTELMAQLGSLMQAGFGHLVELDMEVLARAVGQPGLGGVSQGSVGGASRSASPSEAVAALAAHAERYSDAREGVESVFRLPGLARSLAPGVVTDMNATQFDDLLRRVGEDAANARLRVAVVPTEQSSKKKRAISTSAAMTLAGRMLQGKPFGTVPVAVGGVAPGSVTVNVLNGAGREGVAAQAARILKREGFRVGDVGNANQFVYDQTLIVYKTEKPKAEAAARRLGLGRVIPSRGMYSFGTDVLVIVGSDWPGPER